MLTILTPLKEPGKWLSGYLSWANLLPDWVHLIIVIKSEYYKESHWVNMKDRHNIIISDDSGMYSALNLGLKNTKTEYVTYVNIDDALNHLYFIRLFPVLEAGNFDFIYTDYVLEFSNKNKRFYKSMSKPFLKSRHHLFTSQQGVVWRLNDLRFKESLKYCADTLFFLSYLNNLPRHKIKYIRGYFATFRIHQNNLSNDRQKHNLEHVQNIGPKDFTFYTFTILRFLKNYYNFIRWYSI